MSEEKKTRVVHEWMLKVSRSEKELDFICVTHSRAGSIVKTGPWLSRKYINEQVTQECLAQGDVAEEETTDVD